MSHAYLAAFLSSAQRAWRDRAGLAISILFCVLIMVAMAALWRAATGATGGRVAGYDYRAMLWYLIATEAVVNAAPARRIEHIGTALGSENIESELLRPVSLLGMRIATELGEAAIRLGAFLIAGAGLATIYVGFPHDWIGALLAIPAAILAVACNFAAIHAAAASAFWLRDAKAAWFLYQKLVFLAGCMLLPLQLLPLWLQNVVWAIPFWTMAYVPGRLLSGHVEPLLIVGQLIWLLVLVGITNLLFLRGERRVLVGR